MKKTAVALLCFLTLCIYGMTAFAAPPEDEVTSTVISVAVPKSHKITVSADSASVFFEGVSGEEFEIARQSKPRLLIRAESGKTITSVTLDGEDVTDRLDGGYLELASVYKDEKILVTTADLPAKSDETYTVKGTVTLNGEPLENVTLELRSELMKTVTDENGGFIFEGVGSGELSLTAIRDGKVLGYLSFTLKEDNKTDLALQADGSYTVFAESNSGGVELTLSLDENTGKLLPSAVKALPKPATDSDADTGIGTDKPEEEQNSPPLWWLLLILLIICIIIIIIWRKKKKEKEDK